MSKLHSIPAKMAKGVMYQPNAMRLAARKISAKPCVRAYIAGMLKKSGSSVASIGLANPRASLLESISTMRGMMGPSSNGTITINVEDFQKTLDDMERKVEMLPVAQPGTLFTYTEGWMLDMRDPILFKWRKQQIAEAKKLLLNHLVDDISIPNLPDLCEGDCGCAVQRSPAGDRGGLPRRVPCGRKELQQFPWMTPTTIVYVSFKKSLFNCQTLNLIYALHDSTSTTAEVFCSNISCPFMYH